MITVEEALALVRKNAWAPTISTCGHTGCEDHTGPGRPLIHTLMGVIGADWDLDLEDAERTIREARSVEWVRNLVGHDLEVVTATGRVIHFDVRQEC